MAGKDSPKQRRMVLASELSGADADFALISHPKHIFYLTGIPTNLNSWFSVMKGPRLTSILLVDAEGRASMLAGRSEIAGLERQGAEPHRALELGIEEYTDYSLSDGIVMYGDRLAVEMKKWLGSLRRKQGRVAMEEWHLPGACREVLLASRSESQLIGISGFLLSMRNSKGKDEIDRLERATKIVDRSYAMAKNAAKIGRSELDIYAEVNAGTFRRHGPFSTVVGDYVSGARSLAMGGGPTHRKLRKGDTLILDLQSSYENYWADLCRTFVIGSASSRSQNDVLSALKEAKRVAEAALVPGTKGKEVYDAVSKAIEKLGYPRLPHHAGHGIGLDDQEPPWFTPAEERRLEVGSVCVVEPGIYVKDSGGIRIEDQYVVTEKGPTKLSHFPLALS